ncbi:hypothetical protein A3Q56_06724 [Intoshia linei]|uniref:RIIa domain-containing protein n=1 Tax=Intoshia linei TaxID=1819745 RepID=A0A177AVJ0_9BILA|nr:hypothetical protein A3Q56_06724 [Intoshia linei]
MSDSFYCSQQINIPPDLPNILKSYTKAAVRTQPKDVIKWSAAYFRALANGDVAPTKSRLELPICTQKTDSGLTPGLLYLLHKQNEKSAIDMPRSGRPPMLSVRNERHLCKESRIFPGKSTKNVKRDSLGSSVSMSTETVRISAKKPLLSKPNIKRRLLWCQSHLKWSKLDWNKVLFSDDSKIQLLSTTKSYVRRPKGKRFNSKYTTNTTKYSLSIMVLGVIRYDGRCILVRCNGNVDSNENGITSFCDIDQNILLRRGAQDFFPFRDKQYSTKVCIQTKWLDISLPMELLNEIFLLGHFGDDQIEWNHFLVVTTLFIRDNITSSLQLACELLSSDPTGSECHILFALFVDIYTFVAQIDDDITFETIETAIEYLKNDAKKQNDQIHPGNFFHKDCPPLK